MYSARIQRYKMIRDQKRAAVLNEKRAMSGSTSPPRVIVLFGLSADVDLNLPEKDLLALLLAEKSGDLLSTVASSEYKLRITEVTSILVADGVSSERILKNF